MKVAEKTKEELIDEIAELKRQLEVFKNQEPETIDKCPDCWHGKQGAYSELKQIFDTASVGMRLIDKDFTIRRVNQTFCHMLDLNPESTIGQKCYDLCSGPLCHTPECPVMQVMCGAGYIECEMDMQRFDGVLIPCIITAKPFRSEQGELVGIIEDFKDISDRKRAEAALRESESKFKSYINKSPDGVIIVDNKGKCREVNPAGCTLLGYSEADLTNRSLAEFMVHQEDIGRFYGLSKRRVGAAETTLRRKDGSKIVVEIHATPLENNLYIGFARDITKRKLTEQALYESERNYMIILNGISDLVSFYEVIDEVNFKIVQANSSFLNLVNKTLDQVRDKLIQEIFPAATAQNLIEKYQKVVMYNMPVSFEECVNDFGCFEMKIFPIQDHRGKCTHLIVTSRDISEKKQMEENILKVEKLESIGLLAGGIAHDFNNILTIINGNVALAKMKLKNYEENRACVESILTEAETAASQAKNLTQQLLTFAKGGAPVLKTVSITELLRETVSFALRGSNVRCEYLIADDLWPVKVDEGQIYQVIHNLVLNATQAMPGGGVIKIIAQNVKDIGSSLMRRNGQYVKISIQDTGIGIPEEYQDKIFDPYFTTKQKGSGLGLTTAYSIVSKHKGCITVDSKLGEGTTFHIYLPGCKDLVKVREENLNSEPVAGSGRILVMDDEQMLRYILSEMLVHIGYEVASAADGVEAIELYTQAQTTGDRFDAVIMDLTVPGGMGGKESINFLKQVDPQIRAIVSSGYCNDPVMANFKEYGFKAVVAKPYSIEELAEVLNKVIHEH